MEKCGVDGWRYQAIRSRNGLMIFVGVEGRRDGWSSSSKAMPKVALIVKLSEVTSSKIVGAVLVAT
jgi:hypothetical protein